VRGYICIVFIVTQFVALCLGTPGDAHRRDKMTGIVTLA